MAFTFDATVGGASANSYVSVSEADDFFAAHLEGSLWPTALQQKQAALVMATNRIDRESFGGQRTFQNVQRLNWPRTWIVDRDVRHDPSLIDAYSGFYYRDPNTIPNELKQATFEMALYYIKQVAGENTVDDNDLETLSTYKIGPLSVGIQTGIKADRLPTKVKELLKSIGPNCWIGAPGITFTA